MLETCRGGPVSRKGCGMSVLHAQFCVIHQRLGHCTQVVSSPDHHGLLLHQASDGQFTDIADQFRRLLAGVPTGDAGFDAEQWMGAVFALIESGLADGELGVFCCLCSIP